MEKEEQGEGNVSRINKSYWLYDYAKPILSSLLDSQPTNKPTFRACVYFTLAFGILFALLI